jgi:predicted phage terminase large subunit-like protein
VTASPATLAWHASGRRWLLARHLALTNDKLLQVAGGEVKRLLIQVPPRHGKSLLCSCYFPAWYLGTFPGKRVILGSYEHDFAASWGMKARDVIRDHGPALFGVRLREDRQAGDDWEIAGHGGGMICAGVGGPITGRGADLLVIDDPVKNQEEARSEVYRTRCWEWYRSTAYTRLEPEGAILLIMTRWHEDDLAGRILAEMKAGGERWEVISLPAIAEENDPLGRLPGEALWPERYSLESLLEKQRTVGSQVWAALYQQRPAPPEGALFRRDWWRYYDEPPAEFDQVLMSVDCAFKNTKDACYVVIQVWGSRGARVYLLDQHREQIDFARTCGRLEGMAAKWPAATLKLVEDAANGPAVISALQHKLQGLVPVKPLGGKYSRAQAILPLVEAGNVYLPHPDRCPWVGDFIEECASFPNGTYDDQVDAMSQGLQRFLGLREEVEEPEKEIPEGRSIEAILADAERRWGMKRPGREAEGYEW